VKPREIYEFFLTFGDIASSKVNEDEDGNHLGYGYICYYDPESAARALKATDSQEVWGSKLEVKFFQKKNERDSALHLTNSNIYLKNFPGNYKEADLKTLCQGFGDVVSCKIYTDVNGRNFSIVSFKNEDSVHPAIEGLNGKEVEGYTLFVDTLQTKRDRKKVLATKIMDSNYTLNEQFKLCNLHIRNIPYNAKDSDLMDTFKPFGDIKSVKIEKYLLVTKENNEFKEIPTSKGFGYVCFIDPDAATKAREALNGKFLPKFETWNRPLLIEYFMPKFERNNVTNKINQFGNNLGGLGMGLGLNGPNLKMPPYMNMNMMQNIHPSMMMGPQMGGGYPQMPQPKWGNQGLGGNRQLNQHRVPQNKYQNNNPNERVERVNVNYTPQINVNKNEHKLNQPTSTSNSNSNSNQQDDIDMNYLNSLEDDEVQKRDYLGEIIFKKIENHKISQIQNFTIDTIGKITGMILGIENINEIIEICRGKDNLTSRINEALELLRSQK